MGQSNRAMDHQIDCKSDAFVAGQLTGLRCMNKPNQVMLLCALVRACVCVCVCVVDTSSYFEMNLC
jgi:hypothetical protein